MEIEILEKIKETLENGISCALITVTEVSGSAPASDGDLMLVWSNQNILGTIGGGKFEYETIKTAVNCIEKNQNKELNYVLTPENELGMQCGGSVKVYIKVFKPKSRLVIVGGGHIGMELYKFGLNLEFEIDIFDDRKEFCNKDRFPKARSINYGSYKEILSNYTPIENSYIVIATKGHAGDKVSVEALINKKYNYLGMIGSRKKIKTIMDELIKKEISIEKLRKIYTPIGLDVNSNEPNEIALGILAEIIIIKNNGKADHMKNIKKVNF